MIILFLTLILLFRIRVIYVAVPCAVGLCCFLFDLCTVVMSDSVLHGKIDLLLAKVNKLEEDLSRLTALQNKLDQHESRIVHIERQLIRVTQQAEYSEAQDKRNNLIFSNVPESDGHESWDDTQKIIRNIVKEKMNIDVELFIQRAHRINKGNNNDHPRRIVVKFGDYSHREIILKNRRNLAGTNIYVNEHFTARVQFIRNRLSREFGNAQDSNGRRARLNFDKIWFNDCLYTWDENQDVLVKIRDLNNTASRSVQPNHRSNFTQFQTDQSQPLSSSQPVQSQPFSSQALSQPSTSQGIISQHPITLGLDNSRTQLMSQPGTSNITSQVQNSLMNENPSQLDSSTSRTRSFTFKRRAPASPPVTQSQATKAKKPPGKKGRSAARGRKHGSSLSRSQSLSENAAAMDDEGWITDSDQSNNMSQASGLNIIGQD